MIWLLLAVITNTLIGVIFKYFGNYKINNLFAITLNYFVSVIVASIFIGEFAIPHDVTSKSWFAVAVFLGILFPIIFNIFALSVQKIGIVISTIFQKMSLIAPVLLAIIYYHESFNTIKLIGILAAIVSIFLIPKEPKNSDAYLKLKKHIKIPIYLFLGSAVIDCALLYTDRLPGIETIEIGFVASLFLFAGICSLGFYAIYHYKTRPVITQKDIVAGALLGLPNFFSIFFIMKGLSSGLGGSVFFPLNNVGILVFSSLIGIMLFKEKMNLHRYIGFGMSILAIILLAIS